MQTRAMLSSILSAALAWVALAPAASAAPPAKAPAAKAKPDAKAKPAPKPKDKAKPAKPAAPSPEKLFEDGRNALLTGQYPKAIDLLARAVAADGKKTSYRLHLARAYQYAGKAAEARKQLEAILKATPDHVEAGQLLARIHAAGQAWKDVLAVLEPLLKYRHDYMTYHLLAEAAYQLDKHDRARKYYEEAVKLNPANADDHYQLGNIYLAGNFFALAAEAYEKALALGMDSPILRYKLGSAYFNLRNYFGRVAVATVKSGKASTISDRWYLIEPVPGKTDTFLAAPAKSAVYQIAKAVADGLKESPDIRFLQANIYLNARRYPRAYEMFGKIKDTVAKEDRALFYYYYAQAAFGIGKYEQYLSLLDEAIKLDKAAYEASRVEAFVKVAEQYNQAGDLDKYIEYLARAVAESPQTAALHLKLGDACEEARQWDRAMVQWQMVLDLEPDHPQRMDLINRINKYRRQPPPAKPAKAGKAGKGKKKS